MARGATEFIEVEMESQHESDHHSGSVDCKHPRFLLFPRRRESEATEPAVQDREFSAMQCFQTYLGGDSGNKVVLIRPAGTKIIVSGRRLESTVPPLKATDDHSSSGFTVLGIYFPTEGCWEVNAKAGDSQIKFVTQVLP